MKPMIKNRDRLIKNSSDELSEKGRKDILDAIEYTLGMIDAKSAVLKNIDKVEAVVSAKQVQDIYLVALGKASVPMAEGIVESLKIKDGIVITNKECGKLKIDCIQSSHPVPSEKSLIAARHMLEIVRKATRNDLIVFLISGGGSALVELPRVGLDDLKKTTDILIKHSLSINEINCIRRHLSAIKGGQIIKETKANIVSLIVSDVVGDDLSTIASGLTYYDTTTFDDALEIIRKHNLQDKLPQKVMDFLINHDKRYETLKKGEFVENRVSNVIISSNSIAALRAKSFLSNIYDKVYFKTGIKEDIQYASQSIVQLVEKAKKEKIKPVAIVCSGEVSIDVKGHGKGGRNQHLALLLAEKLNNTDFVLATFATDGKDGNSDAAGAICDGYTQKRARKLKLDIKKYINDYDSHTFFSLLGDCIFTEDTKTNVADLCFCIVF